MGGGVGGRGFSGAFVIRPGLPAPPTPQGGRPGADRLPLLFQTQEGGGALMSPAPPQRCHPSPRGRGPATEAACCRKTPAPLLHRSAPREGWDGAGPSAGSAEEPPPGWLCGRAQRPLRSSCCAVSSSARGRMGHRPQRRGRVNPGTHAAGSSVWPALPRHGDSDPGRMPARDVVARTHTLAAAGVDVGDVQRRAGRG